MKLLTYINENGLKFKSIVRDTDIDPAIGLLQSPPDIFKLDWETIPKTLHNALVERGFFTRQDVQDRQSDFNNVVLAVIGKPLFRLYQELED